MTVAEHMRAAAIQRDRRREREAVPARQSERNAAFLAAVRADDVHRCAALARAPLPADAALAECERWKIRRRLYRDVPAAGD